MRLEALGWTVLVKMDPIMNKTDWGFETILTPEEQRRHEASQSSGEIVAVGPLAWKTDNFKISGEFCEPWAKVGDRVYYSKFGGKFVKDPDDPETQYVLLLDEDIKCKVKEK